MYSSQALELQTKNCREAGARCTLLCESRTGVKGSGLHMILVMISSLCAYNKHGSRLAGNCSLAKWPEQMLQICRAMRIFANARQA